MYDAIIFSDVGGSLGFGRYAGAYRIATALREHGFKTQVVDFFGSLTLAEIKLILDKLVGDDTLLVGFATTLFINDHITVEKPHHFNFAGGVLPFDDATTQSIFNYIRVRNPSTRIVIGGSKAVHLNLEGPDHFILGEGDHSIVVLAAAIRDGQTMPRKISSTDYPYDGFNESTICWEKNDLIFPQEHLPIEIARGCRFRCAFCSYSLNGKGPKDYIKCMSTLDAEFRRNYELFGTTGYMFCDDTYNDSLQKVRDLHKLITSLPFHIEWVTYARLDMIAAHPEMINLLANSGLKSVYFGIETFNAATGKLIGKGMDPQRLKDTLYLLKERWGTDISIVASFIIGLPGESNESCRDTIEWLARDDCPIDHPILIPLNIKQTNHPEFGQSLLGLDPSKYGYTTENGMWSSAEMDLQEAKQLVDEGYDRIKRQKILGFSFYPMLRNLGYSKDEIDSCSFTTDSIGHRRAMLKERYLERLLK